MSRPLLALLGLVLLGFAPGCRQEAPPPLPVRTVPAPKTVAPQPVTQTAPPEQTSGSPEAAAGQPMPRATTELMLQFEARFGRPPSNYSELNRLNLVTPKSHGK